MDTYRINAQGFIINPLQVLTALQFGKGNLFRVVISSEVSNDDISKFLVSRWVASESEENPSEKRSRGISTREEDVEELRAEFDWVTGLGDESLEEDVFVLRTESAFFELFFLEIFGEG